MSDFKTTITDFVNLFKLQDTPIEPVVKAQGVETVYNRVASLVYDNDDFQNGRDFYIDGFYYDESGGLYVVARNGAENDTLYKADVIINNDEVSVGELTAVTEVIHMPKQVKGALRKNDFFTFKNADGEWVYAGIFTNAYRDQDGRPEILTDAAHKNYAEKVQSGEWAYPVLKVYHYELGKPANEEAGLGIGQAEWLAYDPDTKMFFVAGKYYPAFNYVAESLAESESAKGMSHGFEVLSRLEGDNSVIDEYRTVETSVLLRRDAANVLTGYETGSKEFTMSITDSEMSQLTELLGSTEAAQRLVDGSGKAFADVAKSLGLQTKDVDTEDDTDETIEVTTTVDTSVDEDDVFNTDVVELLEGLSGQMTDLNTRFDNMEKRLSQVEKTDVEKQTAVAKATPLASRMALLKQGLLSEDAKVDGRSTIAKQQPKQSDGAVFSGFGGK